jgi:hypothetical protein
VSQLQEERDRLFAALSDLVTAAAPIVEDGGSGAQLEVLGEVFAGACFTVSFPHVDPETGEKT